MINSNFSELYGVPSKAFNQAVCQNIARLQSAFMFQFTKTENNKWSQTVTTLPSSTFLGYALRHRSFGCVVAAIEITNCDLIGKWAIDKP